MKRISGFTVGCLLVTGLALGSSSWAAVASTHSTIRAHDHVSRREKKEVFQKANVPKSHRKYYVVDRVIPTKLGGLNESSNLQLQSRPEAKAKNRIEKYLFEKVKQGDLTLEEAQREVQDWKHVRVR